MKSWIGRGAAALCIFTPFAVTAQDTPDDDAIDEIIVTAQKRATSLQEVPFSIAAVTGEDIKESGATNIVELARNVPGLYIADLGPGQSQVAIRGISAGQVIRDQPGVKESVGIYLDESPISVALFTPDLDLFDLDRVEVLRGPQGTLFGAGSTSGTVRYITAQPDIGEYGGAVDVTFQGAADGDYGGSLRGVLNAPLGENAAMRVVGYHSELPGFIDSVYPGRGRQENVNGGTNTGGRLAFRFEPTENVTITPRIVYQKLDTDGFPRIDVYNILGNTLTTTQPQVDPGQRGQVTQLEEGLRDEFMMGDLKLEFGFGNIGLTSVYHLHRPHRERRARCQPADGQRHRSRSASPTPSRTSIRRCTTTPICRSSARKSVSDPPAKVRSSGWRARSTSRPIASTGRRCPRRVTTRPSVCRARYSSRRRTRRSIRGCRTTSSRSRCSVRLPTASIRSGR